jgi:2-isopropylmalate synthase
LYQALASTRVVIVPTINGPNDSAVMDAQTSQLREKKFSGSGSDTDIITSSARAYVSALNKLLTWKMRRMSSNESSADTTGVSGAVAVEGEAPAVVVN